MNKSLRFLLEALALVALIAACCYGAGLALRAPDAYAARLQAQPQRTAQPQHAAQPLPQLTGDLVLPRRASSNHPETHTAQAPLTAQADGDRGYAGGRDLESGAAGEFETR